MNNDEIRCPRCNSTNLHVDKKGFSGGKALAGVLTVGALGALAGTIGSNNIEVTCLKCGKKFNPIKEAKQKSQREFQEEMAKNNPVGLVIVTFGSALAVFLLFVSGVSIWWSVFLFLAAIIIPLFTGNKK
ncbi:MULTISPECIES: hypothetical protein [Alistipes]|uniref:Nucleic-acid-binding protein n=1 Tax=Siphoviridae sp. ctxdc10 TaxID=2825740 RepID=A0A8S5TSH4_9CAUD|nr:MULTISPECIES: hypothetical protein [Alistipes]DAF85119.1 MAG TPA: nucleic-acid-binding protein [Siphoviridae sp. ctxdc10]DAU60169.1 MAG TPA: nucleic-acid-binding protein [Caudoviricetes sp.]